MYEKRREKEAAEASVLDSVIRTLEDFRNQLGTDGTFLSCVINERLEESSNKDFFPFPQTTRQSTLAPWQHSLALWKLSSLVSA